MLNVGITYNVLYNKYEIYNIDALDSRTLSNVVIRLKKNKKLTNIV